MAMYMNIPLKKDSLIYDGTWAIRANDLNKGMLAQLEILEGLKPSMEGDKVMQMFVQYLHEIAIRQLILVNIRDNDTIKEFFKKNEDGYFFEEFKEKDSQPLKAYLKQTQRTA